MFVTHLLSVYFCFALPSYHTFKAINYNQDLNGWAMYWAVIGVLTSFERMAEWFVSWLPFYWETKTLFLLFLALPQTEGFRYIYTSQLAPFFIANEAKIDGFLAQVQSDMISFFQARIGHVVNFFLSFLRPPSGSDDQPAFGLPNLLEAYGRSLSDSVVAQQQRPAAPKSIPSSTL